jgi:transketolase
VDGDWLRAVAGEAPVFVIDDDYTVGRLGDAVLAAGVPAVKLAVEDVPRRGANDEVLRAHRMDAESIAERVAAAVGVPA